LDVASASPLAREANIGGHPPAMSDSGTIFGVLFCYLTRASAWMRRSIWNEEAIRKREWKNGPADLSGPFIY
jgi:hypothetical protein